MPRALAPWRSFRWKLYWVFGGLVILVVALGVAGYTQLSTVESISADVADTASAHGLAQELAILLADLDAHLDDYQVIGDGLSRTRVESDLEDIDAKLLHLRARVLASSEFAHLVERAIEETAALRDHIEVFLASEGDDGGQNLLVGEVDSHLSSVRQQYNDLGVASLDRVDRSLFSQNDILSRLSFQLLAVGAFIMSVLIGTSLYVGRTVRSIGKVTETASAIAAGDLSREVPVHRRDEIGLLAEAFNSMTDQLRGLIDGLEDRVETRTAQLVHSNEELLRAKDFAETVLNSMTESIAIIDIEEFSIVGANKVFTEMADVGSVDELVGLTCYAVTHERSDPCCPPDDVCPLLELQAGNGEPPPVEHVHRGPNGDKRYVEVSVSPIRDADGSVSRVVHVSRDITQRKLAEEDLRDYAARLEAAEARLAEANLQLQSSNRRLERLVESKDEFLASVSHELRTPLTAIVGFADYLKQADLELDGDERAGIVETICNEGADVANLIEDLLTAARADIGRLEVRAARVDLLAQAQQVVDGLGDRIGEVTILGEVTPVAADPSRVRQIIRNLLTNAARYGGPHVVVRAASRGDTGILSVADDGDGISGEDRERIFQPYERAHDRARVPDSVGIGLPVSRRLARLMSGDITYRRGEGESVFELTLPTSGCAPMAGFEQREPVEPPGEPITSRGRGSDPPQVVGIPAEGQEMAWKCRWGP